MNEPFVYEVELNRMFERIYGYPMKSPRATVYQVAHAKMELANSLTEDLDTAEEGRDNEK